mmetsp:Transcript_14383/g.41520  ORF Transcript_14383/g.41520 Transcript_14383/m.41520 type:complete len:302 (+) Transcript_14383:187-1092(+)
MRPAHSCTFPRCAVAGGGGGDATARGHCGCHAGHRMFRHVELRGLCCLLHGLEHSKNAAGRLVPGQIRLGSQAAHRQDREDEALGGSRIGDRVAGAADHVCEGPGRHRLPAREGEALQGAPRLCEEGAPGDLPGLGRRPRARAPRPLRLRPELRRGDRIGLQCVARGDPAAPRAAHEQRERRREIQRRRQRELRRFALLAARRRSAAGRRALRALRGRPAPRGRQRQRGRALRLGGQGFRGHGALCPQGLPYVSGRRVMGSQEAPRLGGADHRRRRSAAGLRRALGARGAQRCGGARSVVD